RSAPSSTRNVMRVIAYRSGGIAPARSLPKFGREAPSCYHTFFGLALGGSAELPRTIVSIPPRRRTRASSGSALEHTPRVANKAASPYAAVCYSAPVAQWIEHR